MSATSPSDLVSPAASGSFTTEQKEYLVGFFAGVAASGQFPFVGQNAQGQLTDSPAAAISGNLAAPDKLFGTPIEDLCKPERWKLDEPPLDIWEKLCAHAAAGQFPNEADTFRFKFHGLFYVAPAQDSFMIRLRIPAGILSSHQLRGLADLAEECGAGHADLTTRANFQIRELPPTSLVRVLTRVSELGLTSRGAGADNVRNITATPTSGFDPHELIDVRPFSQALHHYILNNRDLYDLPRKFNISFDSGAPITTAADTNDIGFFAVRVTAASLAAASATGIEPGIYFRCQLGGISGHKDFARETGLLLTPAQLVPTAAAMLRVFREHGDRTDRKKARLKYLLDRWGLEKFVEETLRKLAFTPARLPLAACEPRRPVDKRIHLGIHPQSQPGLHYVGLGTATIGRLTSAQMRGLAELAAKHGQGELRLTVWQSVLIPHLSADSAQAVVAAAQALGLTTEPHHSAGGIVACTGNKGCKYAAADTKGHARTLFAHLREHGPALEHPVNIHLTGCNHSCAQHYCGDLGAIATKLPDGGEGYHVVVGGGMDQEQGIGREVFRSVPATELPTLVTKVLSAFSTTRTVGETFVQWSRRHTPDEIRTHVTSLA